MEDEAQKKTEKEVAKVEKQINAVYGQAQKEIEEKMTNWGKNFMVKNDIYKQKLDNGEITQEDYNAWFAGQMFQNEQWHAKSDQICDILHNANAEAMNIVNGGTISSFAEGANWVAYSMESGEGVNFGFGLYDSKTVTSLIKDNPQILPKWKINEPKEYTWNKQKVNNCVTQGIIQGESLTDIAERIATVTSNQNKNLAMTHAQTALGGAQNAGRIQRLQDAKKMGINVVKQWMATLDDHTRDSHQAMDGEEMPVGDTWHPMKFSNGCRFPGDPLGPAHEVFNCRCTLVGDVKDYPEAYERYDNIDGVPIKNMTYKEWEKMKGLNEKKEQVLKEAKEAKSIKNSDAVKSAEEKIHEAEEKVNQAEAKIQDTTAHAEDMKTKAEKVGADKTIHGFMEGPVTYADWENQKDKVDGMMKYWQSSLDAHMYALSEILPNDPDPDEMQEFYDKVHDLINPFNEVCDQDDLGAMLETMLDDDLDPDFTKMWEQMGLEYGDIEDFVPVFWDEMEYIEEAKDFMDQLQDFKEKGPELQDITKEYLSAQEEVKKAEEEYKAAQEDLEQTKAEYLDTAKQEVDDFKQQLEDIGADKVFSNIWYKQDVTYADWEAKKDSIQSKKDYYDEQIAKYQSEGKPHMVELMEEKKAELEEFEKNGEEYSKLVAEYDSMKADLKELQEEYKVPMDTAFGTDAYTQERKDDALWAKTAREADSILRPATETAWQDATGAEKNAAYKYTSGSGSFNRPLRGYDGMWNEGSYYGVGNVFLDAEGSGQDIIELTNLIDKTPLQQDTWLQRGVSNTGLAGFLGVDESQLRNGTQEELEGLLLGKVINDPAFMSCGSSKGAGFNGNILNIYCPEGTKALYCEPFSAFGAGDKKYWDGKSGQSSFGGELETLLQRNTYFQVTKVEVTKDRWGSTQVYLDLDVIDQKPDEIKYQM